METWYRDRPRQSKMQNIYVFFYSQSNREIGHMVYWIEQDMILIQLQKHYFNVRKSILVVFHQWVIGPKLLTKLFAFF